MRPFDKRVYLAGAISCRNSNRYCCCFDSFLLRQKQRSHEAQGRHRIRDSYRTQCNMQNLPYGYKRNACGSCPAANSRICSIRCLPPAIFYGNLIFLIHNKCNKIIHIKKDRTPYIMIVCGAIILTAAFAAVIAVKRRRGKNKAE